MTTLIIVAIDKGNEVGNKGGGVTSLALGGSLTLSLATVSDDAYARQLLVNTLANLESFPDFTYLPTSLLDSDAESCLVLRERYS